METLREGKTSLLIASPERENPIQSSELSSIGSTAVDVIPSSGKDSINADELLNVTERFSPSYVHPEIECKPVTYAAAKRVFDVLFAATILAAASPIMLVAALIIPLTSRGSSVFRQVRVGRGGRYFTCYKFRSMCADAEDQKRRFQHLNEMDGPVFKIKRDPRITRVGEFIRKYSIDELPQLINVIKGDMSIVGPRPPVPSEVEKYGKHERGRLSVHPGLTCLWQINGRNNIGFEQWVELDLLYIENMSFMTDLKIVAMTIPAVVTGTGAH